ncbi:RE1-silencing transcription factor-like [Nasonia vitripennis]|uniref:C2H2-type domain-containing protein n=1 Tax=Nasonia vitripennis TaxID=7425 RepID=A0A7M7QYD4_NASVI|nr:RE1-silencing transcription factor-like [Nasonia vitripennis]
MFNVVKKKALLHCSNCDADANLDVVVKSKIQPNCEKCSKPLIFVCTVCESKSSCLLSMYNHYTRNCEGYIPPRKFSCTECSFKSKYKNNLNKHIRNQHTVEKCRGCGKSISSYRGFLQHKSSMCPYEFNTDSLVKVSCKFCDYFSIRKYHMTRHIKRVHNI